MNYQLRIISFFLLLSLIWLPLSIAHPLSMQDQVLHKDTVWSGEIEIRGVVVVGRQATLRIEPGTIIRFHKIDRNQDGIGDSEIRVLGRLMAEGTQDKRIRFISAETAPSQQDWSYVLIFTSGKKSLIRFAEFNHAYSGVQVHFSTVHISESLFEHNYEGIRFGRADLTLKKNTFTHNRTGIRFTRMEGPATISNNTISNNRIGIFLAPSGQNIKDFFDPDQSGKAWNTGRLLINSNNILNNSDYNLTLGAKQIWNLDVSNNWWGTRNTATIKQTIYDNEIDTALGKAIINPIKPQVAKEAGCSYNK